MARGDHSAEERAHRQNCRYYVACPHCGVAAGEKCVGTRGRTRAANHVERWQLFDPAHVAARAIRKEKTMPFIDANRPEQMHAAKEDLTCKHCGEECYWQEVFGPDGKPRVRLFEGGKPHVCKPSADDFEVLA
jgi:hypothetical protein